ncbi:uncharacterized protein N7446_010154 [Penicillium canescens]|uniref:uncharacterized protein n=1 Tax=Penicillium canescens TaxID=5083 RepID=UPI0026DEC5D8|nr:uncharacterized protein N7446_010154 [Penicillium canescens]KAJ6054142.1 hypothetical protein N7446_010154 [Penicillium canescens]
MAKGGDSSVAMSVTGYLLSFILSNYRSIILSDIVKECFIQSIQTSKQQKKKTKTYNSKGSLVVTHLTTNLPACGLSTAERTGSPVLHTLWSYVPVLPLKEIIGLMHSN